MSDLKVVVAGAAGRMGRTLIRALHETNGVTLAGALEAKGHPDLGKDAGVLAGLAPANIKLGDDALPLIAEAEAVIDFTSPKTSVELADLAAQARIVHVIGTTGFSKDDEARIRTAARHAVIVKSGNMSLGVTLLAALVKQAARALPDFDIEIIEMHHRQKVDAPSGTALLLGRAATEGRNVSLDDADGENARRLCAKKAPSGLPRCAAARSLANTKSCWRAPANALSSVTSPKIAPSSHAAPSRPHCGAKAKSPGFTRWPSGPLGLSD